MCDVIARHACPREVVSDNGGNFQADFDQLMQNCKIDRRLTSPNHAQANILVERFNGALCTALRKFTADNPGKWDMMIPTVLLGYRSTIQAFTKYSPFFMVYARQATLPNGLQSASIDLEESNIETAIDSVHDKAHLLQQTTAAALENIA